MNRHRVLGLVLVAVGILFVYIGLRAEPRNTLQLAAGAALILAGVVRAVRGRSPGMR
jgi:hypothetical protein